MSVAHQAPCMQPWRKCQHANGKESGLPARTRARRHVGCTRLQLPPQSHSEDMSQHRWLGACRVFLKRVPCTGAAALGNAFVLAGTTVSKNEPPSLHELLLVIVTHQFAGIKRWNVASRMQLGPPPLPPISSTSEEGPMWQMENIPQQILHVSYVSPVRTFQLWRTNIPVEIRRLLNSAD